MLNVASDGDVSVPVPNIDSTLKSAIVYSLAVTSTLSLVEPTKNSKIPELPHQKKHILLPL